MSQFRNSWPASSNSVLVLKGRKKSFPNTIQKIAFEVLQSKDVKYVESPPSRPEQKVIHSKSYLNKVIKIRGEDVEEEGEGEEEK